jgi:ribosomal protein L37AE/L43A
MKACPKCGSTNITKKFPQMDIWVCKECGWEGTVIVDFPDESLKKMKEIEKTEKLGKEAEAIKKKERLEKKMKKLEKRMRRLGY